MRRDEAYLLDILLSAQRALKYIERLSWEEFESDELVQDAVMYPLEIMGEAAGHISEDFRGHHSIIPCTRSSASATGLSMNTSVSTTGPSGIRSGTICQT